MEKIRAFIAFKLSSQAQAELQTVQTRLKKYNQKNHVNWSKTTGFHITVEFLGEISYQQLAAVKKVLLKISQEFPAISFYLHRDLDAFPNLFQPNIIIARVGDSERASYSLQNKLSTELSQLGIDKVESNWTPHITLGRNKNHERISGLDTVKIEPITWQVNSIELIQSDLQPGGPKYSVLESFSFKIEK